VSIKNRIEDAELLWSAGRKEGAFIMVLIVVAATSRKRYPKPMADSKAFKQFILDEMGTITGGPKYNVAFPFKGNDKTPLEDILYYHLRCQLVHEGGMPETIVFTPPKVERGKVFNVLRLTDPLGFPEGWVINLAKAVQEARENSDMFK
jgi:hypothetical protein